MPTIESPVRPERRIEREILHDLHRRMQSLHQDVMPLRRELQVHDERHARESPPP